MRRLLVVLVLLVGCAAPEETASTTTTSTSTSTAPASTTTTSTSSRCETPSAKLVDNIASGLTVRGGGKLGKTAAVRSKDFKQAFMVAGVVEGQDMNGSVGVWSTNELDGTGMILAVDPLAQQVSEWPDAEKTQAKIGRDADGVAQAKDCLAKLP